jgi:hypothetical protein
VRFFKVAHDILTTPMGVILNLSLSINCFDVAWYAVQTQKKIFQKSSGKLSTDLFIAHPVQIIRKTCKYILNFTRKLITEPPSGFTLNDSTRKQVLYLSHVFNKRLDDRKDIRVIYFEIYIYAMHSTEQTKKMGIVEEPLSWFTDYLSNRKQDVVFNRKKSTGENINAGVPQGSILRTQLFFKFINDIISELNCRKILFADDTSILAVVKDPLVNVFS